VSGVGWGTTSPRLVVGDISDVGKTISAAAEGFEELLEAKLQASQLPERHTFFFIPVEGVLTEFWIFLDMYPDAEIPEEFALILPSEINNVDKMKKNRGFSFYRDFKIYKEFILSLLLTMVYQQGYEIEYVTSNYIILIKPVYEEELKGWEERLGEEQK